MLVFGELHKEIPIINQSVLSQTGNVDEAAKNLFSAMRELDQKPDVRIIIADAIPDFGLGKAIRDFNYVNGH